MARITRASEDARAVPHISGNGLAREPDCDVRKPDFTGVVYSPGDAEELRPGRTGGNGMVKTIKAAIVTAKDNPPHPTWQWIFSILIALVAGTVGYQTKVMSDLNREVGVAVSVLEELKDKSHEHPE